MRWRDERQARAAIHRNVVHRQTVVVGRHTHQLLRRMVKSQALRFVPAWNLSMLVQALTMVSWTRSSAPAPSRVNDKAKARRAGKWSTNWSRGSVVAGVFILSPSTAALRRFCK